MKRGMMTFFALALTMALTLAAAGEAHYMGDWSYVKDEDTHWAKCVDCEFVMYVGCVALEGKYEGKTLSVCPVCGHFEGGDASHLRAGALLYDYSKSPVGDALVMAYEKPFGEDSEVKRAFSVIFEYAGGRSAFDGLIDISFAPGVSAPLSIIRIDGDTPEEIEYTYDEMSGLVTFTVTGGCGLYIIK